MDVGPLGGPPEQRLIDAINEYVALRMREAAAGAVTESLDAAWAEAEAALPDGYQISALDYLLPHDAETYIPTWTAEANSVKDGRWTGDSIEGQGDTARDALLDLAAKLRAHR